MQQGLPQTYQTWATNSVELLNNQTNIQLDISATLANVVLSLEFYNNDTPVTVGVSGVITVSKQWRLGRIQAPIQYQLSGTDAIQVNGLCSKVYLSLSGLTGCNKVIVNAAQYINQIGN